MKYYLYVLKNYATFTGRARRSEYWNFVLFSFLISIVASILDDIFGTNVNIDQVYGPGTYFSLHYGYIVSLYSLAVFIPGLAVTVRRLHDVGKSGWFFLIILIPLIGAIWLLVLMFTDSQFGQNKYGLNPKGLGNHDEIDQIGSYL